jgi:two-component system sensor histidine kinase BarA
MARQERSRLFEPFSGTEGTGLGLVIARTWVERMGGRLEVASREGLGTTVTFTLPCVAPAGAAGDTAADCPLAGRTALVFDPFEPTCRSLTATLECWGAQVTPVESAAALRQTLAGHTRFDLVVMGLPPGGDSRPEIAVAAQVARQRTGRPALLLVNAEEALSAERCARLGGVGGLPKPVRTGLLRDALLDLLSSRERPPAPAPAQEPAPPPRLLPHGPRVLVVEDEPVSRTLLVRLLEGWGARVETAHDGQQALARAAIGQFDLVVMDLHMPGLDGVETTRRLRHQKTGTRHLPVLALSADAHGDTRRRVIEAGLDDFLTKPVQEDDLFGALAYWLERTRRAAAPTTAAPGPGDEAVIDRTAAVRIAGDADGAVRLLRLMLAELPSQRTELADALAAGNLARVAEVAHKIAGGAIYCAARALEGVARRLEQVARAGDPAAVGREALALDTEIERLMRAGPGASGTHLAGADGDESPRGG